MFNVEIMPGSAYQMNFAHEALIETKKLLDRMVEIDHIKHVSE